MKLTTAAAAVGLITFLQICVFYVNGQGEICRMPNGQPGVCQALPKCVSLLNLYQRYPNDRNVINQLVQSQRNCGSRNINRNPILCCQDNVVLVPDDEPEPPPPVETVTLPSIRPTTKLPPPPPPPEPRSGCSDPYGAPGSCITIKNCPSVLNELVKRPSDAAYKKYVQDSNRACFNNGQDICCPSDTNIKPGPRDTSAPVTQSPSGRVYDFLRPEVCGYSNATFNRVVGGKPAVQGAWPWMALLGYTDSLGDTSFKCGGSLITSRHILTAAHCLRSDLTTVRLGEHDLATESEARTLDVSIVKVIQHPKYDKRDGHSDLAILYLETDVPFDDHIKPICLPFEDPFLTKDFTGFQPFVAGWGKTQEGGSSATVLQQLQLPILPNSQCSKAYNAVNRLISDKQFDNAILCAGYLKGGRDTCQGDSGGPLMQPMQANDKKGTNFFQLGVVSYGVGCARAEIPGVYTRIVYFIDWIKQQISTPV